MELELVRLVSWESKKYDSAAIDHSSSPKRSAADHQDWSELIWNDLSIFVVLICFDLFWFHTSLFSYLSLSPWSWSWSFNAKCLTAAATPARCCMPFTSDGRLGNASTLPVSSADAQCAAKALARYTPRTGSSMWLAGASSIVHACSSYPVVLCWTSHVGFPTSPDRYSALRPPKGVLAWLE